jgi:hypothetical protein
MSASKGTARSIPASIDRESLIALTNHHLSVAAKRGDDFIEPWPGSMASYLLKLDELSTQFETAENPAAERQLAWRTSSFFISGFDFGLAVAAAVINDPLGKPAALWADALKEAKENVRGHYDAAIKDAASVES